LASTFKYGVAVIENPHRLEAAAALGHWTFAQMMAHHTSNGCALAPGDLLGSGTQSGPGEREQGCLMELTRGGREPVTLANGETRCMLEDGDTVMLRGRAERPGAVSIGFGECRGTVLPAVPVQVWLDSRVSSDSAAHLAHFGRFRPQSHDGSAFSTKRRDRASVSCPVRFWMASYPPVENTRLWPGP
jgi:Fumarylacetoacetate (FAA) hydrolase family